MNTFKSILKIFSLAAFLFVIPQQTKAQFEANNLNLIIDWQMNAPISTDFTDKISGWGMNFEVTYSINDNWEAGAFTSFHTNHKYIGRQTISLSPTESLTTDQLRSSYQIPFGATANYIFCAEQNFRPYVGAKIGTMFARNTTYYGTSGVYDKGFGFYISPEVGIRIHPSADKKWGFHIAGYYSYATNQLSTLTHEVKGINDVGFRIGILF